MNYYRAMSSLTYRVCSRCVMDTSDPDITFDDDGVCNHCHTHQQVITRLGSQEHRAAELAAIVSNVKRKGAGLRYDCIIGISGGVDSTYVAWLVKQLGLRPLAVHVDNGWNSDTAVKNIAHFIELLGIDLFTDVLDWDEFRDLQRAFLLASVPDVEIPTDHIVWAAMFRAAKQHGVRSIISGVNERTESHLPPAWSRGHRDFGYIKDVHSKFGLLPLRKLPHFSFFDHVSRVQVDGVIPILNYTEFSRDEAVSIIENELGWRDYGGKHHESVFTRWYQGCYLLRKFGFDKRRSHLSSLVSSGQMTRDRALAALQPPPYDEALQDEDCIYVAKKLGINKAEFDAIMTAPPCQFSDFESYAKVLNTPAFRALRSVRKAFRSRQAEAGA
jgi:N-acetyl sugar amidotransferase